MESSRFPIRFSRVTLDTISWVSRTPPPPRTHLRSTLCRPQRPLYDNITRRVTKSYEVTTTPSGCHRRAYPPSSCSHDPPACPSSPRDAPNQDFFKMDVWPQHCGKLPFCYRNYCASSKMLDRFGESGLRCSFIPPSLLVRGHAILAFIYTLAHELLVIVSISLRTPFKLGVPNVLLTLLGKSGRNLSSLSVSILCQRCRHRFCHLLQNCFRVSDL